jgi:nitrite reductase (NADH) small subunit
VSLVVIMAFKHKLADIKDIIPGKGMVVSLSDGREIALFNVEGKIYALDNACPHMGGPLGEGEIEGSIVTCPWHGWQFEIESGACVNVPGDDATSLPLEICDGIVYLKDV